MRLWLDFGDGVGPVEYTAALVTSQVGKANSNVQPSVESFGIERRHGEYARCVGTLDMAAYGMAAPVTGTHLTVRSDAGALLFQGYIAVPAQNVTQLADAMSPVRFVALEDAFLTNTLLDAALQPATAATHAVSLSEHAVRLHANTSAAERADDVTVTGAEEPVTYVTELFQGDGTTSTFALTQKPFARSGSTTVLADNFAGTQLRPAFWRLVDPGQHLGLGAGGLRMNGGNGLDGQTYMAAQQITELGGTLCAEMTGLLLQPGSDGVLLGMYENIVTLPNCFAGIRVKSAGGAQTLVAVVNGIEVGTSIGWSVGHSYTLRVRLHCAEMQRVLLSYQALVNGSVETWGGGLIGAPAQIVVEVLDEGLASSTPATVLFAGAVSSSPARAIFAPVNSLALSGSAGSCSLKQQGSAWVTTTATSGTVTPRRPGTLDTGEDYVLHGSAVVFFPGRVPAPGELLTVRYRLGQRAQARLQSADAVTAVQQQGLPGLRQQACSVTGPEPLSASDCAAAAQALLGFYASPSYGLSGTCVMPNAIAQADVRPGDNMALPLGRTTVLAPAERVTIRTQHAVPEVLDFEVEFAQRVSNGLSFRVEDSLPNDAILPAPLYAVSTTASLPQLSVVVASTAALQVDAGADPPVGGGFEVRRHDGGWGPDIPGAPPDSELVLRSPVRSFSVPRAAFYERFFVRMYDGSEVPVYSAKSSLVVTHLPVG